MNDRPETATIRVERLLLHAPAKVWRALTDSAAIGQWLMPNDFRAEVGARFSADDLDSAEKAATARDLVRRCVAEGSAVVSTHRRVSRTVGCTAAPAW